MDKKADCKYLIGPRICGAISKSSEGMRRRNRFCVRPLKNHCCYACSTRESCSIRCSYLDKTVNQDSIDREVEKYQNEIGRLTVLHANGEIGEQSFLAALKTLDDKIAKLKEAKDSPPNIVRARGQGGCFLDHRRRRR